MLNFIHQVIDHDMARVIHADVNGDEQTEVLHCADFEGLQLQVCVVYLKKKRCYATVKVINKDGKAVEYDQTPVGKIANGSSEIDGKNGGKKKKKKHTKGGILVKDEAKVEVTDTKEEAPVVIAEAVKEVLPGLVGQKTRRYLNHDWVPRWNPLVTALKVCFIIYTLTTS